MVHYCGQLGWLGMSEVEATAGLLDTVILIVVVDVIARTAIEILLTLVHDYQITVLLLNDGLGGFDFLQTGCIFNLVGSSSSCSSY